MNTQKRKFLKRMRFGMTSRDPISLGSFKVCFGRNRIVILVGMFAIKIPHIWIPIVPCPNAKWSWKNYQIHLNLFEIWSSLFGGIVENFREAHTSLTVRQKVLLPCFLPLGIINIFPRAEEAHILKGVDIKNLLIKSSIDFCLDGIETGCSHTFTRKNLGVYKGTIRLLDYGEKRLRRIILREGDLIFKVLND